MTEAEPLLVPIPTGMRMIGTGRSKFYELIADGKIETVLIGRRRLAKVKSLRRLAEEGA